VSLGPQSAPRIREESNLGIWLMDGDNLQVVRSHALIGNAALAKLNDWTELKNTASPPGISRLANRHTTVSTAIGCGSGLGPRSGTTFASRGGGTVRVCFTSRIPRLPIENQKPRRRRPRTEASKTEATRGDRSRMHDLAHRRANNRAAASLTPCPVSSQLSSFYPRFAFSPSARQNT
jgi:hypothetical protein